MHDAGIVAGVLGREDGRSGGEGELEADGGRVTTGAGRDVGGWMWGGTGA